MSHPPRRGRFLLGAILLTVVLVGGLDLERHPGGALTPLLEALAAFCVNGLVLGLIWHAAARRLRFLDWAPPEWTPLLAAAFVAVLGYGVFWAYLLGPFAGKFVSISVIALACADVVRKADPRFSLGEETLSLSRVLVLVGILYVALLYLFPSTLDFYGLANGRWRTLYHDNSMPHAVASDLYEGKGLHWPAQGWLASDRPPLQSGWMLLTWVLGPVLGIDGRTLGGTAALWLQLTWVLALYGILRGLGMAQARACAWTSLLSLCGFFIMNSVFTWPKLSAGAFACGAFGLWVMPAKGRVRRSGILVGAALAALALLSHSGVAFSFVALVPLLLPRLLPYGRTWGRAILLFVLLMLPWAAFQKFYAPPGNRLLKMHLAGQVEVDPRGTLETIRDSYSKLSWDQILAVRRANFAMQLPRDWGWVTDFSSERAPMRRGMEFFLLPRSLTWWIFGLGAFAVAFIRKRSLVDWRLHLRLIAWTLGAVVVWCLALYFPTMAIVHQGSYCVPLMLFALLSAWLELASPFSLPVLVALQGATFATTWAVAGDQGHAPASGAAVALVLLALAALAGGALRDLRREAPPAR